MGKTSRRRRKDEELQEEENGIFHLNPNTKRGIIIVLLFALAALLFLSFFGIAGSVGAMIDEALSQFFGFDHFLLPIFLVFIGATLVIPEKRLFSHWNYIGILFFFVSFNTLLNHILVNTAHPLTNNPAQAGGHLGQLLGTSLPNILGWWGTLVILGALLVVSILLIFNAGLGELFGIHTRAVEWIKSHLPFRSKEELWNEDDFDQNNLEEDDEEVELENEDEDEPQTTPTRIKKIAPLETPEETVLTSRQRRKIIIPIELLQTYGGKAASGDIERNGQIIEQTFSQFGIDVEMAKTSVGPTVTQFTLRPSSGIKLSRIVSLQNDLALALAAHPIRIEAPIPGKSLVGIEVPNQKVATVSLRELIDSKSFKTRESNLSMPLGMDVSGKPWVTRIEKLPHLLVAGATGSGKSVCLNTIIISLLYENGPDDLKLILVDPKRVELTTYSGIPHLLIPPITKVEDTVNALKWTVREMERRLDVMSKFGARDIISYNQRAQDNMPYIVVVIDELADLMTTNQRDVEAAIVRIAQLARATGIHLILATQRPSVDVITGLIKANIPGRIAFSVASQTDSRTILDCSGAEKLLGRGDLLFSSAEVSKPKRLQGAFISEEEVKAVVQFLKQKGEPDYNYEITDAHKSGAIFNDPGGDEPLFDEAVQAILADGRASTSLLQRRLRVGYARAARIMDLLEEQGIIGESRGSKAREILVDEWPPQEEMEPVKDIDDEDGEGVSDFEDKELEQEDEMSLQEHNPREDDSL